MDGVAGAALDRVLAAMAGPGRAAAAGPGRGGRGAGRRAPGAAGAGDRLGQVGGLLGGDRGAARGRARADAGDLAAAGADARPGRRRRPAGLRAATVNSANVDDWQQVFDALGADDGRRPAGLARAAGQPAVRRPGAAAAGQDRAAGGRRGALHLRLGLRLPPGLPAADPPAGADRRGQPGAGHHRDGQRAGHRGRRRPARRRTRWSCAGRWPGRQPAARGGAGAGRGGALRLGRRRARPRCPARGSSTR